MSGHNVILIRDSACPGDAAIERAQRALGGCPACRELKLATFTVDEVVNGDAGLECGQVAWVACDATGAGVLFEVIATLQDRHIPVILTPSPEQPDAATLVQDGVVLCPPETEPEAIRGMLRALRSQVPVLRAMRNEMKLLRAHQGGLCDQIGRIDEELRLAAQLQREFLPKGMVSIGDVDFRVFFRPASYVSGDIYDVIRLDEKHIGFFIADAVGHGVPAALLTMYIKRSLVTKRIDSTNPRGYRLSTPSEALDKLNRDLVEQQSGQVRFATACYGVVNCETLEVCIGRAGHPFPIVLRGDGRTQTLEPEGGLLGVFDEQEFEEVCLKLEAGDRLLLYSDGFETAFPDAAKATPDRTLGSRRKLATQQYVQEFEDLRQGTADEAILRLEEKLDAAAGSLNQRDDLTLVCLSVAAVTQSAAEPASETAAAA